MKQVYRLAADSGKIPKRIKRKGETLKGQESRVSDEGGKKSKLVGSEEKKSNGN